MSSLMTSYPFDNDGIWAEVLNTPQPGAALFLDRDGIVVEDVHHLHRPEDVRLVPGAAGLIGKAQEQGHAVIIVTNQSGIGRGLFTWEDFAITSERILSLLQNEGAKVDAVFACPFHARGHGDYRHPDHPDRKPNPGMIRKAAAILGLDLNTSWIVGDKASDMRAGIAAGLEGGIHVHNAESGHGGDPEEIEGVEELKRSVKGFQILSAENVADCQALIPFLTR